MSEIVLLSPQDWERFSRAIEAELMPNIPSASNIATAPDPLRPAPTPNQSPQSATPNVTIAVITALPKEQVAVRSVLENVRDYMAPGRGAGRRYMIGDVPARNGGRHVVALALADMGNNMAVSRATRLLEHFPRTDDIIMVGIAGGVPHPADPAEHVRLGDIVVSDHGGVTQYDFVVEAKKGSKTEIKVRNPPRPPSAFLLEAVRLLHAEELLGQRPWLQWIEQASQRLHVERPHADSDILVTRVNRREQRVVHPNDLQRIGTNPRIFFGPIASSNTLLKNASKRDALRARFGVKAVEMEGSGIADATWNHGVGYLIVRGICDYCDMNKNNLWQEYAAVVAAAYARALIESMPAVGER